MHKILFYNKFIIYTVVYTYIYMHIVCKKKTYILYVLHNCEVIT